MTKEEILDVVAMKFCNGCSWLNPNWIDIGAQCCKQYSCLYRQTFKELEKHLEKAEKETNK